MNKFMGIHLLKTSYSLVAYPSALLFNRKLAIENGCYPEIGTSTDFALVINLSSDNYISILNKYVCYYNVHEDSISRSIESIKNYQSYLDWSFKNPKIDPKIKILIKKYILDQIFLFALRNVLRGNIDFYNYSKSILNNYSKNRLKNIILNLANTRFARFIYNLRKSYNVMYKYFKEKIKKNSLYIKFFTVTYIKNLEILNFTKSKLKNRNFIDEILKDFENDIIFDVK